MTDNRAPLPTVSKLIDTPKFHQADPLQEMYKDCQENIADDMKQRGFIHGSLVSLVEAYILDSIWKFWTQTPYGFVSNRSNKYASVHSKEILLHNKISKKNRNNREKFS